MRIEHKVHPDSGSCSPACVLDHKVIVQCCNVSLPLGLLPDRPAAVQTSDNQSPWCPIFRAFFLPKGGGFLPTSTSHKTQTSPGLISNIAEKNHVSEGFCAPSCCCRRVSRFLLVTLLLLGTPRPPETQLRPYLARQKLAFETTGPGDTKHAPRLEQNFVRRSRYWRRASHLLPRKRQLSRVLST